MTYEENLLALLESYKAGTIDAKTALEKLHAADYTDLGFAKLDHNRSLRQGFPEVVYCEGKTVEQVAAIMESWHRYTIIFWEHVLMPINLQRCRRCCPMRFIIKIRA